MKDLIGEGGGGNSKTPTRTKDSLLSQDYFEIVLGISEGPIKGLASGTYSSAENFFVGSTPLANAGSNQSNFPDFALTNYHGYEEDPAIAFKLGGQSSNIQIGVRLSQAVPVIRQTGSNLRGQINRLEFRIYFNQLVLTNDDGTFETTASFQISYKKSTDSAWILYEEATIIKGKTTSGAVKDFAIDVPLVTDADWDLRVIKNSSDNFGDSGDIVDLSWESVQAISNAPQKFDDLALVHIYGRASNQFSSIPDFAGIYEGLILSVPTNYNPETRTYDESTPWDGSLKQAYTNNPAWILYNLCTNVRWGLPRYYLTVSANRYEFYNAAKWCDEQVPIPGGGTQPRFTFNEVFQDAKNGLEALNYIAGAFNAVILDDGTGTIILRTDQVKIPKQIFTPENVQNGEFNYTFTDISTRYNDVTAVFINPDLDWNEDRRLATLDNTEAVAANGRIPTEFVAVGCTDVHEAVRRANYHYLTSNTEVTTVAFVTSRFGMFTEAFETIYVADPSAGWSSPGRIKSITSSRIFFRDPVYFPDIILRTLTLQTFDGLRDFTILPPQVGACYYVDIQSGAVPSELPDRTVFAIQDQSVLGLAKPFKVLSIEELDGTPDAFKITALEVNPNKYPDSDAGAQSESVKYSYQIPGEPILPPSLDIESGRVHLQINSDGTIIYRAFASWFRPFQAFTDYYQIDYREVGAENWETTPPIYGDSIYISPLKDNTRYNFRLFAITPFGKRSLRYLEVLDYLVQGKVQDLENVSGLAINMVDVGWLTTWGVPTFPDYDVTELRMGLSIQAWEDLGTFSKVKGDRIQFGFLGTAAYRIYAKYLDTSKNSSADAVFAQWEVQDPSSPVLSGNTIYNVPEVTWLDCQTTQPIRLYRYFRGNTYVGATLLGVTQELKFSYRESSSGLFRYWVEAEDMAGNLSAPSSIQILVLPTINEAMEQLEEGLEEVRDIIEDPVTGLGAVNALALTSAQTLALERYQRITSDEVMDVTSLRATLQQYGDNQRQIIAVAAVRQELSASVTIINGQIVAQAEALTSLGAQVGDNFALVNEQLMVLVEEDGRIQARWGVAVTVNGRVSGVVLNAESGSPSTFVVLADKFAVAFPSDVEGEAYPFIVGLVDGVASVGINGNLYVDGSIIGRHISSDTIEARHIRSDQIETRHLKADIIEANNIKSNQITAVKIASDAIETRHLQATSITAGKMAANSITAANGAIAALAVDTLQIAGYAITIPVAALSVSDISTTGSGGDPWVTLQTLSISASGYGFIRLDANCFVTPGSTGGSDPSPISPISYRILRGSTEVMKSSTPICVALDTPGPGSFTYTYQVAPALGASASDPMAGYRLLIATEVKK